MYKTLQQCQLQLDGIQAIDFFLAREICAALNIKKQTEQDGLLFHSIMAVSQALRNGHTCLKLDAEETIHNKNTYWSNLEEHKPGYHFPCLDDWHQYLAGLPITSNEKHPLIYEQNRLYLRRYWQFEDDLSTAIRTLLNKTIKFDLTQATQVIKQLFQTAEDGSNNELDWQKIAVANAIARQFTIIAGGPGTGKTFTVTRILAALQSLSNTQLKIAMVAPTGKAAQRLNESIQKAKSALQKNNLSTIDILDSIPAEASTLHRLLGVIAGSHNFRFNEKKQLPYDVVLVDEISMIDLPLMTRLIRAIAPDCRIIMLGDADQLPSVAAGSVLADLAPRQIVGYSKPVSRILSELTGFEVPVLESTESFTLDHLTVLQKSHRFDGVGEIGQLAKQVINGHAEQSWKLLEQGKAQIERITSDNNSFHHWLEQMVERYYVKLFSDNFSIKEAFEQLNKFRFMAATRTAEQGVEHINGLIEQYLRNKGFITNRNEFYPGRPIMVTENHYNVGLFNGDTGLLWMNEQGKLQAVFPEGDSVRWLSLGRLPKVETVYAMTIHKTQGSEFEHVALVLPTLDSLILSRELLYTGITRASKKLSVWSGREVWRIGVQRKVQRYSGLGEKVFS